MKRKLTLNAAIKKGFNPIDCVKYYDKDLSNRDCDGILYEFTCFPFDMKMCLNQLFDFFKPKK